MFYYKKGGTYVASHVKIPTAEEISKEEYDHIKSIIDNRPIAPNGFAYRLTAELEWELYEVPIEEPEMSETEEKALAYDILTGVAE